MFYGVTAIPLAEWIGFLFAPSAVCLALGVLFTWLAPTGAAADEAVDARAEWDRDERDWAAEEGEMGA